MDRCHYSRAQPIRPDEQLPESMMNIYEQSFLELNEAPEDTGRLAQWVRRGDPDSLRRALRLLARRPGGHLEPAVTDLLASMQRNPDAALVDILREDIERRGLTIPLLEDDQRFTLDAAGWSYFGVRIPWKGYHGVLLREILDPEEVLPLEVREEWQNGELLTIESVVGAIEGPFRESRELRRLFPSNVPDSEPELDRPSWARLASHGGQFFVATGSPVGIPGRWETAHYIFLVRRALGQYSPLQQALWPECSEVRLLPEEFEMMARIMGL